MNHISCTFEAYIEIEGDDTEHMVEVSVTGSISHHSGIVDVKIENIFSVDADHDINVKKVSVQDMNRLMELAEDALINESIDGSIQADDDSDVAYESWVDNDYSWKNKGDIH